MASLEIMFASEIISLLSLRYSSQADIAPMQKAAPGTK